MDYLIFQSLILLLAAFIVGCILGYWLKRTFGASNADSPAATTATAVSPATSVSSSDGRPAALAGPIDGAKDDLKRIKGVGKVIEDKLNGLGIFHFSQIAGWGTDEITWVDGYLSFKGRIERDGWTDQAKTLADGGETNFSKRVDKGEIASSS